VNHILEGFEKVTPELVQKTAQEWLRKTNRTVLVVNPGAPAKSASAGGTP
jgi:zinc protease